MTRKEYRRRYYLPQAKIHKNLIPTCFDCSCELESAHRERCDQCREIHRRDYLMAYNNHNNWRYQNDSQYRERRKLIARKYNQSRKERREEKR